MKFTQLITALLLINQISLAPFAQARTPMSADEAWELSHPAYCYGISSHPYAFMCGRTPGGSTGHRITYLDNGAPEVHTLPIIEHQSSETIAFPADCWQVPFNPPSTWPVNALLACLPDQPQFVVAVFVDQINQLIHVEKRGLKDKAARPLIQPTPATNYRLIGVEDIKDMLTQSLAAFFISVSRKMHGIFDQLIYINLNQEGSIATYPITMAAKPDPVQDDTCLTYMTPAHLLSEFCIQQGAPKQRTLHDLSALIGTNDHVEDIKVYKNFPKDSYYQVTIRRPEQSLNEVYLLTGNSSKPQKLHAVTDGNGATILSAHQSPNLIRFNQNGKDYAAQYHHTFIQKENRPFPPTYAVQSIMTLTPHFETAQEYIQDDQGNIVLKEAPVVPEPKVRFWETPLPGLSPLYEYDGFVTPERLTIVNTDRDNYPIPVHYWQANDPKGLILEIHGGPRSYQDAHFDARIQYFNSHGYSVIRPEPRGSEGYGKAHMEALVNHWNDLDVSDFLTVTRDFKNRGYDNIFVTGFSYGGIATLEIITHPHSQGLFKGAIPMAGVYDWALEFSSQRDNILLQEERNPRLEELKKSKKLDFLVANMLEETTTQLGFNAVEETDKAYHISSINFVNNITVPVMQIHGLKDSICNINQAHALEEAMLKADKPMHSFYVYNVGHTFADRNMFMAVTNLTLTFMDTVLAGALKAPEIETRMTCTDICTSQRRSYNTIYDFDGSYSYYENLLVQGKMPETEAPAQAQTLENDEPEQIKPFVPSFLDQSPLNGNATLTTECPAF